MTRVWEAAQPSTKGSDLLTLLALADNAHDDGTRAYPAVDTIAKKIHMSERAVQYSLRALEDASEIVLRKPATQYTPNVYDLAGEMFPANNRGAQSAPEAENSSRGANRGASGVQTVAPDPSGEPSQPSSKNQKKVEGTPKSRKKKAWKRRTKGKSIELPDEMRVLNDEMRASAEKYRLLGVDIESVHAVFVANADRDGTLYVNWMGAWQTYLVHEYKWAKERGTLKPVDDAASNQKWQTIKARREQAQKGTQA